MEDPTVSLLRYPCAAGGEGERCGSAVMGLDACAIRTISFDECVVVVGLTPLRLPTLPPPPPPRRRERVSGKGSGNFFSSSRSLSTRAAMAATDDEDPDEGDEDAFPPFCIPVRSNRKRSLCCHCC